MATVKNVSKFLKFIQNGSWIPLNPMDDISEPEPVEFGYFLNNGVYGNGEASNMGEKEYSINLPYGSKAYNHFESLSQRDDHGLGQDIFFKVYSNIGHPKNEYGVDHAIGFEMHCQIIVVQPPKISQNLYTKDSTGENEIKATVKFSCVLLEVPTPIYK